MSITGNIIFNDNNNFFLKDNIINGKVHIRINQRKSNKYITIIQDLELLISFDEKDLLKYIKTNLNCNGNVTNHKEYGKILQFQGDKRYEIKKILLDIYNISESNIKVHG